MCRFCEEGHSFDTDYHEFNLSIYEDGIMDIQSDHRTDEVLINYCPMCGKKLDYYVEE